MPRSSRHRSSHKSHRRSSPADWSASEEERDSEPERRKSSHAYREVRDSGNGHGTKRKGRVEMKDEDRWDSGLVRERDADEEQLLVEKKSKGEGYATVDEREKHLKEGRSSSRRHEGREKEKEKEKERESERRREKEKERERERERRKLERYEEDKREKERYEESRKREADTAPATHIEEIQIGPKKEEEIIPQIEATEKMERESEKLTKRRKEDTSPSEKSKEKEKQYKSHSHSSSKEKKAETDKYKESEREKRHREREREERREREYAEYRSSRYKKRNGSDADPFEEYSGSSSKYSRSGRRAYEETEDIKYLERESNNENINNDNRDAEMKEDYNYVKYPEKEKEKEKEKVDSISSPRDSLTRQRSKESPKIELDERSKSTNSERTPSKRSIKLEQSLEISSTEIHYERSPVSTPHYKYSTSSRGTGSSKYRERERERERDRGERDGDVAVSDKAVQKREPTPIGASNRPNSIRRPNYNYNNNSNNNNNNNNNNMNINANNGNNNWNNGWNSNGFIPMPAGPPAQHGFNPFGGPPPLFNMRPPMKLGFHDPMDRFPMRPFAWHNGNNNSSNNNMLLDEIGNPNMWDPFNWGENNRAIGGNMWNNNNIINNNNKGQGQVGELSIKDAVKENLTGTVPVLKIEEMSEKEILMSEKEGMIKVEREVCVEVRKEVENCEKASEILEDEKKSDDVAEFDLWEKYVIRVGVSKDLVDDVELYNKCASVLGGFEKNNGVSSTEKVKEIDGGMRSVFKSVFPTNQDVIFHKSMSLYKKLAERPKSKGNGNSVSHNSDKLETPKSEEIYNEKMEVEKNSEFNDNNNDNENSEVVRGDNEVGLSRIPNFESTH